MCDKCESLIRVPIGIKIRSVIKEWDNQLVTGKIEMIIDRYPTETFPKEVDAFIHVEEIDKKNDLWRNYSFEITNCPFCGRKLNIFERGNNDGKK